MAKYMAELNRTASASLSVGTLTADGTTPRRNKVADMVFGSEASAGDGVFLWQAQRCTTAGTSTSVTPTAIDSADAAALSDVGENHTVDPTLTSGAILMSVPLNQRATFRWVAPPGGEIVTPAVANNGVAIRTPTAATVAVTCSLFFDEQ